MIEQSARTFSYSPAGPVIKAFHESSAFVRGIMGPVGSGKTTALAVEVLRRARMQTPSPDGIRRTRWAVLRNTEPQLKTTTIPTFLEIIPAAYCKVSYDSPITMRLVTDTMDCEIMFLALDNAQDTRKLLSLALTGLVINEAREIGREVLDQGTARVGRFPSGRDGGCTWSGVIMDTNPPDSEHWWHELAETVRPESYEFFRQPSGLADDAENLHNLNQSEATLKLDPWDPLRRAQGRKYYERIVAGKSDDWKKVYVDGEYGFSLDGKAVFTEYSDSTHTAKEVLEVVPHAPVIVGVDPGLGGSAAVFLQRDRSGRWLVVHELVAEDMGLEEFGRVLAQDVSEYFPDYSDLRVWIDPAAGSRSQLDTRTAISTLKAMGLPVRPAPSQDILSRLNAVHGVLSRMVSGGPGFVICPKCVKLRKALTSYHYRRLRVSGGERFHDTPEKDEHSHIIDALGYGLMGAGEGQHSRRPGLIRPAFAEM